MYHCTLTHGLRLPTNIYNILFIWYFHIDAWHSTLSAHRSICNARAQERTFVYLNVSLHFTAVHNCLKAQRLRRPEEDRWCCSRADTCVSCALSVSETDKDVGTGRGSERKKESERKRHRKGQQSQEMCVHRSCYCTLLPAHTLVLSTPESHVPTFLDSVV